MSKKDEAYEDYKNGLKYKEIAEKHGVSLSTVKSWATRYWKPQEVATKLQPNCNQKSKKLQPSGGRKRGGQLNNKNGVDGMKNNKNAVKHGGYSIVEWEELTDTERSFANDILTDSDEEAYLEEQIALYTIREKRILRAINTVKEASIKGKVETHSNISAEKKTDNRTGKPKMDPQFSTSFLEREEFAVLRLEKELTAVQRAKTKAIQALSDIRRAKGENDESWLEDFISAVEEVDNEEE